MSLIHTRMRNESFQWMSGTKVRTAAVLKHLPKCANAFGWTNHDQLSQTDDFVQIYLIYPQWVIGRIQVYTPNKQPSDLKRMYCIHAHEARQHQLYMLRLTTSERKWVNIRHDALAGRQHIRMKDIVVSSTEPTPVPVNEQARLVESDCLRVSLFN